MSGENETLACKAHDSEKLCSPKNAASDWCGIGSVDKKATFNISIKPGMFCLHALQIKKCFGLTIFSDCVCMKVYQI